MLWWGINAGVLVLHPLFWDPLASYPSFSRGDEVTQLTESSLWRSKWETCLLQVVGLGQLTSSASCRRWSSFLSSICGVKTWSSCSTFPNFTVSVSLMFDVKGGVGPATDQGLPLPPDIKPPTP